MTITDIVISPTDGLRNIASYPTNPAGEAAAREQIQSVIDQVVTEVNSKVAAVLNSDYPINSDVLVKTNTTAYAPTTDYHPSTKKYTDDSISTANTSQTSTIYGNVLRKDNSTIYTPTGNYHPSTKKYVDNTVNQAALGHLPDGDYATIDVYAPVTSLSNAEDGQLDKTIKGNSIVQLADNGTDYVNWTTDGGSSKGANGIHLVADELIEFAELSTNLSPSTQYTIIYKVTAKNIDGQLAIYNNLTGSYIITSDELGINKQLLTTQSTIASNKLKFFMYYGTNGTSIDLKDIMILEGDWTNKEVDYFQYGTKSTLHHRVKSIGKNSFDKNPYSIDTTNAIVTQIDNGIRLTSTSSDAWANCTFTLKIDPGITYRFKRIGTLISGTGYVYSQLLTSTDTIITASDDVSFAAPDDGILKIRLYVNGETGAANNIVDYTNIQLERGTTATAYEQYKESKSYIVLPTDKELRSLPNGVKDEITNDGKLIQRINEYTLQSADILSLTTTTTNFDYVLIQKPTDMVAFTITSSGQAFVDVFQASLTANSGNFDTVANLNKTIASSGIAANIVVTFPKDTYEDLAAAKADLAGKPLIYQFATALENDLTVSQLPSYEDGTMYIDRGIGDDKIYDSGSNGITIEHSTLPIDELEQVYKVTYPSGVEVLTPISLTDITIAGNKLSFTISGASTGEKYRYSYLYSSLLGTLPNVVAKYPINVTASIADAHTKVNNNTKEIDEIWSNLADIADKELIMFLVALIPDPATATTTEIANKVNEILNIWK